MIRIFLLIFVFHFAYLIFYYFHFFFKCITIFTQFYYKSLQHLEIIIIIFLSSKMIYVNEVFLNHY